jgi:putative membrane protein
VSDHDPSAGLFMPGPDPAGPVADRAPAPAPATLLHRLHPLSPVLRGWRVLAVFAAFAAQNSARGGELLELAVITAAGIPVAVVYGYLSWRFTRFYLDGDNLRIDSGVLFRNQKQVPLARVQAVDILRPLLGRVLGLAELRLDVAGGGKDARLSYLAEGEAHRLRAELLARAAGIDAATPEAPENVLVEVPPARLILALLLSVPVILGVLWLAVSLVAAVWTRELGVLGLNLPVLFGFAGYVYSELVGRYGFTVAQSPDGLRLRSGLLDTRAQTVPPGRVQAVQVVEPWLWRRRGWARLRVNVAGYAGAEDQSSSSILLPVGTREEVHRVLDLVLPPAEGAAPGPEGARGDGVLLQPVPRRARWLAPIAAPRLGLGADGRLLAIRDGRLRRELTLVPHERMQSVRLTQGPLQRRLGLATVHVDLPPGSFAAQARHRDQMQARRLVEDQAGRARAARRIARPDKWMTVRG